MAGSQQSQNLLLGALPPAEFDLLRSALQRVHMPLGSVLVRAGEIPTKAFFPHNGVIASSIALDDGHVVEVRITGRDGALGATAGAGERPSFTSSIVRLAGEMSIIGYRSLDAAMDRSAPLRAFLARYEALQQAVADQSVACNTIHLAQARLARRLLRLRNESGRQRFTLTQEVLAEMLGVRRNSISKIAHEMQKAKLIRYTRGILEIIDEEGLSRLACECYHSVTAYRDLLEPKSTNRDGLKVADEKAACQPQ